MFSIRFTKSTGRIFVEIFGFVVKFRLPSKKKDAAALLANLPYELADPRTAVKLPVVESKDNTLKALMNSTKSVVRLGDGEFKLMSGENICFQKYTPVLETRLKEIIKNDDDNILTAVTDMFGGNVDDYHRCVIVDLRQMLYQNMDLSKKYYNTLFSRKLRFKNHTEGKKYYNNFKKLWNKKDVVLVEGEGCYLGIGNDLFDNAKSIERIVCPMKNAFSKYDKILAQCLKQPKSKLFIMALGPTATVLAYDLAKQGYRALDAGHIDTAYEAFLRNSDRFVQIEGKIVFNKDRRRNKIKECSDKKYYEQITAKLT
ncbi:MAG: GT-D fold domain-containing protein [Heliobacteriaceae bacterium]|jgi:glycosyltransferase family protein|nr:GT-D fold domain-containing protein [Heliobacteriaceae bacterium]